MFDAMHQTRGHAKMDYKEYMKVLAEYKEKFSEATKTEEKFTQWS